ncbi:MAG: two-component sensor histidine kinase [Proteobacteria bacterium]|nr:two-component sensor histidine kinase [Pseudomonadota bacterium]
MTSLRRRLLVALWIAVCGVGALSALIAYWQVDREANALLDHQLAQVAAMVAGRDTGSARAAGEDDSDIEVASWRPDGTLQYASSDRVRERHAARAGFSAIRLGQEPYRLYAADIGGQHVEVAQPQDLRDDQAEAAALAALLPILLLLPVLAIVIALVIRALLQPVRALAATVATREAYAEGALATRGLPSEVVPLVDEINKLLARQREAAQRERDFIADAAHALRTPLAALQLQADVLDGSPDPAERAARLADLRAGIRRAARLAAQLLHLARTESGGQSAAAAVDLDVVLEELRALQAPAAERAGVQLVIAAASGARVRGDTRRLLLIFGNLVENALRYSPPASRVEVFAQASGGGATVEVRDEGPGIAAAAMERVFARFGTAPDDRHAGSGLGLATVRSLVHQLGGEITLHNRSDGPGLIARVQLPGG